MFVLTKKSLTLRSFLRLMLFNFIHKYNNRENWSAKRYFVKRLEDLQNLYDENRWISINSSVVYCAGATGYDLSISIGYNDNNKWSYSVDRCRLWLLIITITFESNCITEISNYILTTIEIIVYGKWRHWLSRYSAVYAREYSSYCSLHWKCFPPSN